MNANFFQFKKKKRFKNLENKYYVDSKKFFFYFALNNPGVGTNGLWCWKNRICKYTPSTGVPMFRVILL